MQVSVSNFLKGHADSLQAASKLQVVGPVFSDQSLRRFMGDLQESIRKIRGVGNIACDTEWDNTKSYLLKATLKGNESQGGGLRLVFKISRIAPVAYAYWLSDTPLLIGTNVAMAGMRLDGRKLKIGARKIRDQIVRMLQKGGIFVFDESAFGFRIKRRSRNLGRLKVEAGLKFYFG